MKELTNNVWVTDETICILGIALIYGTYRIVKEITNTISKAQNEKDVKDRG